MHRDPPTAGRRYGRDPRKGQGEIPGAPWPLSPMPYRDEHASKTPNRSTHICYSRTIRHTSAFASDVLLALYYLPQVVLVDIGCEQTDKKRAWDPMEPVYQAC